MAEEPSSSSDPKHHAAEGFLTMKINLLHQITLKERLRAKMDMELWKGALAIYRAKSLNAGMADSVARPSLEPVQEEPAAELAFRATQRNMGAPQAAIQSEDKEDEAPLPDEEETEVKALAGSESRSTLSDLSWNVNCNLDLEVSSDEDGNYSDASSSASSIQPY